MNKVSLYMLFPTSVTVLIFVIFVQHRGGYGGGGAGYAEAPPGAADYYFCKILLMPTQLILIHAHMSVDFSVSIKLSILCCTYSRCDIMMLESTEAVCNCFGAWSKFRVRTYSQAPPL